MASTTLSINALAVAAALLTVGVAVGLVDFVPRRAAPKRPRCRITTGVCVPGEYRGE